MCTSCLEVWGNLTFCGAGSLRATGSQCGVFALGALVIDGCLVDGRADGRGMIDASVAGVRGATVTVVHMLLPLVSDRAMTAASLACMPSMASLPWTPPGWTRPAP